MVDAVQQGIRDTLAAGTALTALIGGTANIWYSLAPGSVSPPYLIFNMQVGNEDNETKARSETRTYLVKGLASSLGGAVPIADAIDALMHDNGTMVVSGYTVFQTKRVSVVRFLEVTPGGQTIGHAGGEYTIRLDPDA